MANRLAALAILTLLFPPTAASGQTSVQSVGSIQVGEDTRICDSSIAGAMRYEPSASSIQVCKPDGINSCPNIGDTCSDGAIFAGDSPDGNVPMYTTPAHAPSTYTWNDGTTNYIDMSMANCTDVSPGTAATCQTGEANTAFLVGATGESDYPFAAAEYCDGLTAHGQSDWYLPAQDELNVLYTNKSTGDLNGTFNETGSFPAGYYWSSSESGINGARFQRFSNGLQFSGNKDAGLAVRCVRKSSTPPYNWDNWGE